jgi:nicotinamidase-related amidase
MQPDFLNPLLPFAFSLQVCVQTSMREANDRGLECLLVTDATESYFAEFKAATIEMVKAQGGIVGWVADSAAVVAALAAASS